jgi:hypothetical protein
MATENMFLNNYQTLKLSNVMVAGKKYDKNWKTSRNSPVSKMRVLQTRDLFDYEQNDETISDPIQSVVYDFFFFMLHIIRQTI